ncbi:V-type ATP synthase subunit F [Halothermothrix orenii]|uniref:V-type ATP synthase subunit F n=1 Tax=Halothermothrix orenii (strain H 168 / OCM 544 / DSM 9562) TaxID=373903 RepID=B8CZH0_HALOH|nr:V-type ATP synthase subunit F [Halothermothrix orenii]ACL70689.1 V-type ATP synthase subunit F [Halothermothrix orenii H 168]
MKIFCISDNIDTNIGLRLAGVDGIVVHEREEVLKAIEEARKDKELGILIITRKLAQLVPEVIDELKLSASLPLVVEIPDRHLKKDEDNDYITRYVRDSIGIKV